MNYITPRNLAIGAATICLFSGLIGGAASDDCTAGLVVAAISAVALAAIMKLTKSKKEETKREWDADMRDNLAPTVDSQRSCFARFFNPMKEPIDVSEMPSFRR